jgi:phosphoribosylanthranilate isomerase
VNDISKIMEIPLIKAFRIRNEADIKAAEAYEGRILSPLFDAWVDEKAAQGLPGGTGHAFDWSLLKEYEKPYMLAGGLTPENIQNAIRLTGASMVDVSSGVESARGVKSPQKIRAFMKAAKG